MKERERPAAKPHDRAAWDRKHSAPNLHEREPKEHPAAILAVALVAVFAIAFSVTQRIFDSDFWQHLVVGKAIWSLRSIPMTNVWTWPGYGQPYVLPSWLFRALLWPFWSIAGIEGLFVWRWITTLAAFGILWAAARRMGARGVATLWVMVLCALSYRKRSQIRPETLIAILFALQIWVLETWRQGGADRTRWLIAIALVWANAHISYHLGFLMIGIHVLDAWRSSRSHRSQAPGPRPPFRSPRRLVIIASVALAVSFVNPFGGRTLWEPFEYFLHQRGEPLFRNINELQPVYWNEYLYCGLPFLLVGWPLLTLWRVRKRGMDVVELLTCAFFTVLAVSTQRFVGFYALAAAPYVARDLEEWIASRSWRPALGPVRRAAIASVASIAICLPEWSNPIHRQGIGLESHQYPIRACDFIARHGVGGRGFNQFYYGGYQLYRFWPERERLPFMDIHATGTVEDRYLYVLAQLDRGGWERLDGKYHFDYVLLSRGVQLQHDLLDLLDADSTWSLVFVDDPAALYVRRSGRLAPIANDYEYRKVPGGPGRMGLLRDQCKASPESCSVIKTELGRIAEASEYHSEASSLLANIALMRGEYPEARRHLDEALAVNPWIPRAHERLALIALEEGKPDEALLEIDAERPLQREASRLDLLAARAYRRRGDLSRARALCERVLRHDPGNREALDSLNVWRAASD